MRLTFRSLSEEAPDAAWREVFNVGWPGWREWFLARGGNDKPRLEAAHKALRRHMPEIESLWERLVTTAVADADAARFLSFWSPPRYLVNCSQAVLVDDDGPLLIRNYDLDPRLSESTLLKSAWRRRQVVGMVEGMAGLADGMNDGGLAASLTFGGRTVTGPGFGIPWIMRYLLELCSDVAEAVDALRLLPCHMSYNVSVIDRQGNWATVFLAPDRPAIVTKHHFATNHQLGVEWPGHGRITGTLERERHLRALLERRDLSAATLAANFGTAPLFSAGYARGFGTVYTAAYRPARGEVTLSWQGGAPQCWRLDDFRDRQMLVAYSAHGSALVAPGEASARASSSRAHSDLVADGDALAFGAPSPALELSDPTTTARHRLAAFRQRNHQQAAQEWVNLNQVFPGHDDRGDAA